MDAWYFIQPFILKISTILFLTISEYSNIDNDLINKNNKALNVSLSLWMHHKVNIKKSLCAKYDIFNS